MQLSVVHQRILLLLKFLLEQTDEAHYVSVADILRFWEAHGIHGNRKNVYSDIQLLMDSGVDVICIRNMQNRYFIGSRLLELPELKLLVDAVESSHLITEKKSAALIEKLGHLTSRHNAALLNRPVYMDGTAKPDNETVYYAIDAIQTAIHKRVLRHRRDPDGDSQTTGHLLPVFRVHAEKGKGPETQGLPLWIQPLCPHLEPGFLLRRGLVGKARQTGPVPGGPHDGHPGFRCPLHSGSVL